MLHAEVVTRVGGKVRYAESGIAPESGVDCLFLVYLFVEGGDEQADGFGVEIALAVL